MDFNAIATALEGCATSIGLNAYSYVPDSLPNVGFYVGEMDLDLNTAMRAQRLGNGLRRGTDEAVITCRALVARYDDKQALAKLREYMGGAGPLSLVDAIEQNRHLDGSVDDSFVRKMRGNRMFDVGGTQFYGVEIDIFVIGSG